MSTPSIEQFESADIEPGGFDHEAHVYVAWRYLQVYEQLEAISRYRAGLKQLVAKFGAEDKYHETITWFFMLSIAERMNGATAGNWESFKTACPELFQKNPGWIGRNYSAERLASRQARETFLLPDSR